MAVIKKNEPVLTPMVCRNLLWFDFVLTLDETGPDTEVIQGDYTSLIKEPDTDVVIQCNRYQTGYGSISWYKDG